MRSGYFMVALMLALCVGSESALQAQLRAGTRALGMGGAYTAIAEGDEGAEWNPAAVAGQRGFRFAAPEIGLLANGAGNMGDLFGGVPSGWDNRLNLFQRLSGGTTSYGGAFYTGFTGQGFGMGLAGFGSGVLVPTDGNGAIGHITTTAGFSVNALSQAVNQSYQELGFSPDKAQVETNKILAHIQKEYPGATHLIIPEYNSHIVGQANAYGMGFASMGRMVGKRVKIGLNLGLVGAVHGTAYADFNKETFTDMAARVTGTASPALVDRVLMRLNLRHKDGTFFSGAELAGDASRSLHRSGIEFAPAADLGTLWRVNDRLRTGLVVRNLIPAHFSQAAPLNTYVDMGAAYTLVPRRLLVAADLTNLLDSSAARLNGGLEWQTGRRNALRMGLYHGKLTYGASLGGVVSFAAGAGLVFVSLGSSY